MRRREMLLTGGSITATALAGCLASGQDGTDGGNATGSETERTITVSGTGEVTAEPDLVRLRIGVEATEDTAQAARDDLARRSEALREALLEYGIDEDDITTRRFRIRERIDRRRMEAEGVEPTSRDEVEEFVFYEGTHSLSVELEDIDDVDAVIDTAVDAGADEINRVTFTLSDEKRDEIREQAVRNAIGSARSEADAIAEEVDAEVIEATVVDASGGRISPVRREGPAFGDAPAATPAPTPGASTNVEPGDVTVSADVRVQYRME